MATKTRKPSSRRKPAVPKQQIVRQPEGQEADEWSWCEIQKSERFRSAENEKLLAGKSRDELIEIITGIRREAWLAEALHYGERSREVRLQNFSGALRANERAHEYGRFKYTVDNLIRNGGHFASN